MLIKGDTRSLDNGTYRAIDGYITRFKGSVAFWKTPGLCCIASKKL